MTETELLERLRRIIATLPETSETMSYGTPTWWGGKKTFACFHSGTYDEGRPGVWFKAGDGGQTALVAADPARFFLPKYLAFRGWVGMRLGEFEVDWDEVEDLLTDAYRLVAPRRALAVLDDEDN